MTRLTPAPVIARADGVTQSQAAARASALGALPPPPARGTVRFIFEEGDAAAQAELVSAITKAVARVGNMVVERQIRARAAEIDPCPPEQSEEELAALVVKAVTDHLDRTGATADPP